MSKKSKETISQEIENQTPRKSELLAEQKRLLDLNDSLLKEMQQREYEIDLKSKKIFDRLLKFLEKEAPWGHTTATGLIMLYHNLREQKEIINRDKEWNGKIRLRSANVTILWSMVTKMTGVGFYEAKAFVELVAVCGESLSKAVQQANADNAQLRENHHQLSMIDDQLASPDIINDVVEEPTPTVSLANEVDPVAESV